MVAVIADFEEVLASLGEAVAVIEALRTKVLRLDPEPRGTRTDPVEDELNEGGAEAGLLVIGKEVEAFELAVFGEDVGVGEAAGPSEGVAHEGAVILDEPGGVVGVGEESFVFLQVVGLGEEGLEVGRGVEVAEGLRKRGDGQFDEGVGVGRRGAANRRHGDRIGEGKGVASGVGNL